MNPFNFAPPTLEWMAILPMAAVAVTGILALVIEVLHPKRDNGLIVGVSLAGLLIAAALLVMQFPVNSFESAVGTLYTDNFGNFLQLTIIAVTGLAILFSEAYLREKRIAFGEFYPLVLWSATGGMIMCSTTNLLMIFLGLEILSISLYVMAGMSRSEEKSEESALKYFLLGAFASGFLLYGIAFVYGATGSLQISDAAISWVHNAEGVRPLLLLGLGLMLIGLSFKAALVPFHQWTPDVYQGAPTNVTAFMAAASKVAAFGALYRVLDGMVGMSHFWVPALSVIAVLTMTVGNLIALSQRDVKRTLGYSSIAHAGYILVAILARTPNNMTTVAYYLASYALMTVGAFAVVTLAARKGHESTRFESLHGLARRSPLVATMLVIFVISLIGIPPTSGFVGKLGIFNDAVNSGLTWLAIALAINSAISAYYYLGIIYAAVIVEPKSDLVEIPAPSIGLRVACVLCAAGVLAVGMMSAPMISFLGLPQTRIMASR